jgi:hypothetical protein
VGTLLGYALQEYVNANKWVSATLQHDGWFMRQATRHPTGQVCCLPKSYEQRPIPLMHMQPHPVVDVVLFAPPNVGPPDFVKAFNKLVNARRVAFQCELRPLHFGLESCRSDRRD